MAVLSAALTALPVKCSPTPRSTFHDVNESIYILKVLVFFMPTVCYLENTLSFKEQSVLSNKNNGQNEEKF